MNQSDLKKQVVFLLAQEPDGTPIICLGVSKAAWDYMKTGKTHNFDLTKAGVPLKIMMFGGLTQEDMMRQLKEQGEAWGVQVVDTRGKMDFAIDPKKPH